MAFGENLGFPWPGRFSRYLAAVQSGHAAIMLNQLKEDLNSIFARDPAARNLLEVLTTYPGVHALLFHRLSHLLWLRGLKWPARMLSHIGRFLTGIDKFAIGVGHTVVEGNDGVSYNLTLHELSSFTTRRTSSA
jgi:hypothetical protein